MKTLHLYLLKQALATLGMTVFVFTFVLLLGGGVKDILPYVISRQVSPWLALQALGMLIPFVLAFALPMGMLTAALLVFGRFSADQELIAARASGISLVSLVTPVLLLSLFLSGVCAWINCEIAPSCRVAFNRMRSNAGGVQPARFFQSRVWTRLEPYSVYVGKVRDNGSVLEDVFITCRDEKGNTKFWVQTPHATVTMNPTNGEVLFNMEEPHGQRNTPTGWEPLGKTGESLTPLAEKMMASKKTENIPISDMTFRQLLGGVDEIEHMGRIPSALKWDSDKLKRQGEQDDKAFKEELKKIKSTMIVNLNRQAAFSFACVAFTLIGIPLGIRSNRRETSIGIAIALLLVLIYFSFLILGQAWEESPGRFPHLVVWLPDFLFETGGGILLWKANRKG